MDNLLKDLKGLFVNSLLVSNPALILKKEKMNISLGTHNLTWT